MYVVKRSYTDSFICYQLAVKNHSHCTINAYKSLFASCKVTNKFCIKLNQDKAREMIWRWSEKGLSPSTINKYISRFRAFYKYLQIIGIVNSNPWNKIPALKVHSHLPQFLSKSDIDKIYSYKWNDTIADRQDKLCISLMLNYGLRVSEAAAIKIKHIDIFRKSIFIPAGKGKKQRFLPMLLEDEDIFITMANTRDSEDFLLPSRLNNLYQIRYVIRKRIEQICSKTNVTPQTLRHTYATMLMNNGMSINTIKELLGHSSIATTQLYSHVGIAALKVSYNEAFQRSQHTQAPQSKINLSVDYQREETI